MSNLGFIRVAAATPKLIPANTEYNTGQIIECVKTADNAGCGIVVFPELCITGSSCGDIFFQELLYKKSLEGLRQILIASETASTAIILGFYLELESSRINCAAFVQGGEIKGIVPKMFISGHGSRWFASGAAISSAVKSLSLTGRDIPFGSILFKDSGSSVIVGIEISGDACRTVTPGALLSLNGANVIANPSATPETAAGAAHRREIVTAESKKNKCGYILASAGVHESTTDAVFSGHNIIAENGKVLAESDRYNRDTSVLYTDMDFETIRRERMNSGSFNETSACYSDPLAFVPVYIKPLKLFDPQKQDLMRVYHKTPFVPDSPLLAADRCSEVFNIQCAGLAGRLTRSKAAKSIIGVSGGLDSALALLVCANAHNILGRKASDIVTVTMPGFGTSDKTRKSAASLMNILGTDVREISIKDSVTLHLKDIGHDPRARDVTYENAQARERTQILMDLANKENGIVIGTGDLSEASLGWCTFNGDHMSMYNVNAGVPKTLVKAIIQWFLDSAPNGSGGNAMLSQTLEEILTTPISPELLPPDERGNIAQETEISVGSYLLNDFFIYYTTRYGFSPEKMIYTAKLAFKNDYSEETIKRWLGAFYKRFISQQFKRNCSPDGPRTGSVSLSPREGLSMPSDADYELWLSEVES